MSIYEMIANAITDNGTLSDDFVLPDENLDNNGLKFAPGAIDGIILYHGMAPNDEEKEFDLLKKSMLAASDGNTSKAFDYAYEFAKEGHMLHHIDSLQKHLIEMDQKYNVQNILGFASDLVFKGEKKEAVKLGLAILELIDVEELDAYKNAIKLLAKYDEFTLNAAFHMVNWKNASQELFEAVKCVKSWGRIHIVRMWQPENEEMEEWLIKNGVKNDVAEYSGLDCFEKVHYVERLDSDMSLDIYRGMSDILCDLLAEGPVRGISVIENKKELISKFLKATKDRNDLAASDYQNLFVLMNYCRNDCLEYFNELKQMFDDESFSIKMNAALEKHECFKLARNLGYDYHPYAYEMVCEDCLDSTNAWWASMLILDDYRVDELCEMMNNAIDLNRLASGSSERVFPEGGYQGPEAAEFILQALDKKVGVNIPLVKAALLASVGRIRNRALSTIESWMQITSKPIEEISLELTDHIRSIVDNEVVDDVKKRMIKILSSRL